MRAVVVLLGPLALCSFVMVVCIASSAVGFEELTVTKTNYAIPSGALFVATTGDDNNNGTELSPFRTVGAAINAAAPGDTIVLRAGTYREGDHVFSKPLTFQPYPNETVWMKGSEEVTAWTQSGAYWRHDNWTTEFNQNSYDPGAFDPNFLHAGKPDMVFVDGSPLTQVGSLGEMSAGTFFVDYAADELYVGVDPTGRTVEASTRKRALRAVTSAASGTVVRGLGFMHYAGSRFAGTLQSDSNQSIFENNTVAWSASRGMAVYDSTNTVIQGNTLIYNGLMGLGVNNAQGLIVEGNRIVSNNQERFVQGGNVAEASGAKITSSSNLQLHNNDVAENLGIGLWLDISVHDATIVGNEAHNNESFGIHYEISADAIIAGNIATGNQDGGIVLSNASQVQVYNNTLANNSTNLAVLDDSRVNTDPNEVAQGITWISDGVVLKNNILSNTDGSSPLLWVRDFNSVPIQDADDMIDAADFNGYYRTSSSSPAVLAEWWRGVTINEYSSLSAFQTNTGSEASGIGIDEVAANPFFRDESSGDYRLRETSVGRGVGEALPLDVANALGLTAGVPVDLGALQSLPNWARDSSGNFHDPNNWSPAGVPTSALLGEAITAPRTVSLSNDATLATLELNNTHAYTLSGPGKLILDAASDEAMVLVEQGHHQLALQVNVRSQATVELLAGAIVDFSVLDLEGNTLTKTGAGTMSIQDPNNVGTGIIILAEGTLGGVGTVPGDLQVIGGTVTPGNSPGTLNVTGAYAQAAGGTLEIEIAGTTAGSEYDQLLVGGVATLDGTLLVSLTDGFSPKAGDQFDVLVAAGLVGDFSAESLPALDGFLSWVVEYDTINQRVNLSVVTPFTADFDGDGDVDNLDLLSWESAYGQDSAGDANGDGRSDGLDFLSWQREFTGDLSPPSAAATTIPEPSGEAVLLGLVLTGLLYRF